MVKWMIERRYIWVPKDHVFKFISLSCSSYWHTILLMHFSHLFPYMLFNIWFVRLLVLKSLYDVCIYFFVFHLLYVLLFFLCVLQILLVISFSSLDLFDNSAFPFWHKLHVFHQLLLFCASFVSSRNCPNVECDLMKGLWRKKNIFCSEGREHCPCFFSNWEWIETTHNTFGWIFGSWRAFPYF